MSETTPRRPTLKQAFPWKGSKYRLAPRIIEIMPRHTTYVEVFGGSGAVLLRKEPSSIEVFNDINSEVINFFEVLREQPIPLIYKLWMTPYSRELFRNLCKSDPPGDPLMCAWRFFALANMSFSGNFTAGKTSPGNWGRCWQFNQHGPKTISAFIGKLDQLYHLTDRLKGIYLESLDFGKLIEKWDRPDTLFYCDPPYVGFADMYQGSFDKGEHERLAEELNAAEGKVILSYYPDPLVSRLYKGWRRVKLTRTVPSSGGRPGEPPKQATELLLCNFQPRRRRR